MKKRHFLMPFLAALAVSAAAQVPVTASEPTTTRIVVKYKDSVAKAQSVGANEAHVKSLSAQARVQLSELKETTPGTVVYTTEAMTLSDARVAALRIAQDPDVEYAAPDVRVRIQTVPNDPWAHLQWPALAPDATAFGSANFFNAAPLAGSYKVVVAVIDTGYVPHSDLQVNEIPGYDFVSDVDYAGDGGGRDNDPSDPGDYCIAEGKNSSWHGLKVAGLIGAVANNGIGIAGAASRNVSILQVRALGRCGGWLSDIADAVTWAAGGSVTGAPLNGTPARVINLSLGAPAGTACFPYMQDAVNYAISRRAVVIASAGNEGAEGLGIPAACSGVISVGAHTRSGDLAAYSNRSALLTLTAPGGGDCQTQRSACLSDATVTLGNQGTHSPAGESEAAYFAGTSAAGPHVSAAAALMLAANGDLDSSQVRSLLVSSVRPHAADSFCAANPGKCGAGMLDAYAALGGASAPSLSLSGPTAPVQGSTQVVLTVTPSGGTAPYTYTWRQTMGTSVALNRTDAAQVSFTSPARKGDPLVFEVRVASYNGAATTEMVTVQVNNRAVLLAPSSAKHSMGTSFSRLLEGTDADGDAVSFVLLSGPQGAAIQGNTLVWPTPVLGSHRFVLMATDGALNGSGDSAQQELLVEVVNGPVSDSDSTGGDDGGGGSHSLVGLLVLLAAVTMSPLLRRRQSN